MGNGSLDDHAGPMNGMNFSISVMFPAPLGHGVYSASNRSESQKQRNNVCGE
jgi:hypothetical protein